MDGAEEAKLWAGKSATKKVHIAQHAARLVGDIVKLEQKHTSVLFNYIKRRKSKDVCYQEVECK